MPYMDLKLERLQNGYLITLGNGHEYGCSREDIHAGIEKALDDLDEQACYVDQSNMDNLLRQIKEVGKAVRRIEVAIQDLGLSKPPAFVRHGSGPKKSKRD